MASPNRFGSGRGLFVLVSLLVLVPIAVGSLARATAQARSEGEDSLFKHLSVFTEVLSLIQRSYVDETSMDRLFAGAFEGTIDALDSLSAYVPGPAVESYQEALSIGAGRSGLTIGREAGISFVIGVEPGSPADASDLESGDVLTKVDGRPTPEIPLWELQILLAGDSKAVDLEILRRGQSQEKTLNLAPWERRRPTVESLDGVPILRIAHLSEDSSEQVGALLTQPEVAQSGELIVDLRGIAGGNSEAAFAVAGLFLAGPLGDLRQRGEVTQRFESDAPPRWIGRMAVLADGGSQGASEILVATLKSLSGTEVIGTRTFGHAGRNAARPVPNGATLFFTDSFYGGPDGQLLDEGVEPGIVVRPGARLLLGGDEEDDLDPVLDRALEWIREESDLQEAA